MIDNLNNMHLLFDCTNLKYNNHDYINFHIGICLRRCHCLVTNIILGLCMRCLSLFLWNLALFRFKAVCLLGLFCKRGMGCRFRRSFSLLCRISCFLGLGIFSRILWGLCSCLKLLYRHHFLCLFLIHWNLHLQVKRGRAS